MQGLSPQRSQQLEGPRERRKEKGQVDTRKGLESLPEHSLCTAVNRARQIKRQSNCFRNAARQPLLEPAGGTCHWEALSGWIQGTHGLRVHATAGCLIEPPVLSDPASRWHAPWEAPRRWTPATCVRDPSGSSGPQASGRPSPGCCRHPGSGQQGAFSHCHPATVGKGRRL